MTMQRIGKVEKQVVKLLYGRQIHLPYLKRMIICEDSNEWWLRSISRLLSKGLVEIHQDVANLTPKGILLAHYLSPFPSSLEEKKHQATILVTPEKASQETGYSIDSIKRKKAPFHYLTCFKTLYVLKRVFTSEMKQQRDFFFFPLVEIYSIPLLIPKIPDKGLIIIRKYISPTRKNFYRWSEILDFLLRIGKYYEGGIQNVRKTASKD